MDSGGAFQAPFGPPKETALSLSLVMALMGHAATVHSPHTVQRPLPLPVPVPVPLPPIVAFIDRQHVAATWQLRQQQQQHRLSARPSLA